MSELNYRASAEGWKKKEEYTRLVANVLNGGDLPQYNLEPEPDWSLEWLADQYQVFLLNIIAQVIESARGKNFEDELEHVANWCHKEADKYRETAALRETEAMEEYMEQWRWV